MPSHWKKVENREFDRLYGVFLAAWNLHYTDDLSSENLNRLLKKLKKEVEKAHGFYLGRK